MKRANNRNRENILSAALELFKAQSYDEVTISDICKAAGCSNSTFYYQFGTKENLACSYMEYTELIREDVLAQLLSETRNMEKLWLIHETIISKCMELGPSLYGRICFLNLQSGAFSPENTNTKDSVERLLIPLIKQGQKNGEIRNHSTAESIAHSVSALTTGAALMWCVSNGSYDLMQNVKFHLSNLYDLRDDLRISEAY
ncbi:MAG: TetR/AcrR family transcriptional regulator [Clostridia bacterium]|nr:TetR/AcrR family transcriptional regulator [Clostridia bacterium]